jgi:hypothetical protein
LLVEGRLVDLHVAQGAQQDCDVTRTHGPQ